MKATFMIREIVYIITYLYLRVNSLTKSTCAFINYLQKKYEKETYIKIVT